MKYILLLVLFFSGVQLMAQYENYEIKVISTKYQNIKGHLKKISPEGIAVEDYMGNYFILRANELTKIKVRKRGLTIGEGAGGGAIIGLSAGAVIWSLDENGESFSEMATLTGVLTGSGAAIGTIAGAVAQVVNTRLTIVIKGDEDKYKADYKKLTPYLNKILTVHVN